MIRNTRAELARATGMRYPDLERELASLSEQAQRDLIRLIRDLQAKASRERRLHQWWR